MRILIYIVVFLLAAALSFLAVTMLLAG